VLASKTTSLFVESSREQQVGMVSILIGISTSHDALKFFLPVRLKEFIGFIEDSIPRG
jgi:hypothetical protein